MRQNPGGEASSSTSRPVVDLTQETFPVIGNISTSDLVDGLRYCHPPPGVPFELETRVLLQRLSCIGRSRPTSGLKVIHLITEDFENLQKLCIPGQGRRFLHLITTRCSTSTASADTRQCASRITFSRGAINNCSEESQGRIKLFLVSHIHNSETNLRNFLNTVERSQAPFDIVLVTVQRTGPEGKLQSLKDLALGGGFAIFDDNQQILEEFERSHHLTFQVRKPGQKAVPDWNSVTWSISEPRIFDRIAQFVRFLSNR